MSQAHSALIVAVPDHGATKKDVLVDTNAGHTMGSAVSSEVFHPLQMPDGLIPIRCIFIVILLTR